MSATINLVVPKQEIEDMIGAHNDAVEKIQHLLLEFNRMCNVVSDIGEALNKNILRMNTLEHNIEIKLSKERFIKVQLEGQFVTDDKFKAMRDLYERILEENFTKLQQENLDLKKRVEILEATLKNMKA